MEESIDPIIPQYIVSMALNMALVPIVLASIDASCAGWEEIRIRAALSCCFAAWRRAAGESRFAHEMARHDCVTILLNMKRACGENGWDVNGRPSEGNSCSQLLSKWYKRGDGKAWRSVVVYWPRDRTVKIRVRTLTTPVLFSTYKFMRLGLEIRWNIVTFVQPPYLHIH